MKTFIKTLIKTFVVVSLLSLFVSCENKKETPSITDTKWEVVDVKGNVAFAFMLMAMSMEMDSTDNLFFQFDKDSNYRIFKNDKEAYSSKFITKDSLLAMIDEGDTTMFNIRIVNDTLMLYNEKDTIFFKK